MVTKIELLLLINFLSSFIFAAIILLNIKRKNSKIIALDIIEITLCFIPGGTIALAAIFIYLKTKNDTKN